MELNAKYFKADDITAAVGAAEAYFGQKKDAFLTEVIDEGGEGRPYTVLAVYSPIKTFAENMAGSFKLYFESDGVYLEIYKKRGNGASLATEQVMAYLLRKKLFGLDSAVVLELLEHGAGRARVAPWQEEQLIGEEIEVTVSQDEMEAAIVFSEPDKGGKLLTELEIITKLKSAGIVFGLDKEAISACTAADKVYGKRYKVAAARPAEHGEDGSLEFLFDIHEKSARPVEDEKGKVDYRNLDLFEPVKKGQLLVRRKLATPGVHGSSVRGKELKARPGREVNFPKSKNAYLNEEKTELYAEVNGKVDFVSKTILVSNVYRVGGDCDLSVGNIDFDGSVVIGGNVQTGIVIKASGSIIVGGVVEGAELYSGSNIELKRGIQGMDRGKIQASGSITAQFIERAVAVAGEDIVADVIIHSTVEVGRTLILNGKHGSIMGGNVRVASEIRAKALGSVSHTQTNIEVGILPYKRTRLEFLKKEAERLHNELEKLEKLELYLKKADAQDEAKQKIKASAVASRLQNTQLLSECSEELSRLEYELEHAVDGKIHITDTAYPGVKIAIGNASYRVNEPVTYSTFKYSAGEVIFTACEVSGI